MVQEEINEIIRQCQAGSETAFRKLVETYQETAFFIAYNMLGDPASAQDISQEAFIKVYYSIDRFNTKKDFHPWFYRIVMNLCIDHLRKYKHTPRPLADEIIALQVGKDPEPDKVVNQKEKSQRIRALLQELPVKYRTALVLCDIEGLSSEEAGRTLKTSAGTVRWRLHQARQLFKKIWEKETHDE